MIRIQGVWWFKYLIVFVNVTFYIYFTEGRFCQGNQILKTQCFVYQWLNDTENFYFCDFSLFSAFTTNQSSSKHYYLYMLIFSIISFFKEFFFFFLMWTILKVFLLNLLQYCFCFMFWFFGPEACGILAPRPGVKPTPPALEGQILTIGPPGKSPQSSLNGVLMDIMCWFYKITHISMH